MVWTGYVPKQYSQPYAILCVYAFGSGGLKAKYTQGELWREAEPYTNKSIFSNHHYCKKPEKTLEGRNLLKACKKLGKNAYRLNLKNGKKFVEALRDLPEDMREATNKPNTEERDVYKNFRLSPSEGILSSAGNRLVPQNHNRGDEVAPRKRRREAESSSGSGQKKKRKKNPKKKKGRTKDPT